MKAFPKVANWVSDRDCEGMDLRDYFAAHALQALISKAPFGVLNRDEETDEYETMSFSAYEYADEMMKAREQNEKI